MNDINIKTKIFNDLVFFQTPSLKVSFNSFEVCFKDHVLYLYSVFFELNGSNLKFVDSKIKDFGTPRSERASGASRIVQFLRTVLGHFTTPEKQSDLEKINYCQDWYKEHTGCFEPSTEEEFKLCINALLDDCIEYLTGVYNCIASFEINEFKDILKGEWQRMIHRNFTKYQWQTALIQALDIYGMNHYDSMEIVNKEINKWTNKLKLLQDGFVFEKEARKIIESYLQEQDLWPADANDLITLGVPKGPGLREMIVKAKALYYEDPCPKDELMKRFKQMYLE